jgi:hypothetical protein
VSGSEGMVRMVDIVALWYGGCLGLRNGEETE